MATAVSTVLIKDADSIVDLICLTDAADGSTITTATVTVTMTDTSDVNIPGSSWPISMPHVSKGTYRGVISDSLVLAIGQQVRVVIVADDGPGRRRIFHDTVTVTEG